MIYELKRIDIFSLIKNLFVVFLVIGFIGGMLYGIMLMSLVSLMTSILGIDEEILQQFARLGFIGALFLGIVFSLFTSVLMSAFTAIAAASYNLVAGMLGGIKLELKPPYREAAPGAGTPEAADV